MNSEIEDYKDISARLYNQAVAIIERARSNIVHSVNHNNVLANWLIGRIIVDEIQSGSERADYGKKVLERLSIQLNSRYGSGFSVANLKNFRQFYLTFTDRMDSIRYPMGSESMDNSRLDQIGYTTGSEFPVSYLLSEQQIFSPRLSWSHYRAIMRVKGKE